MRIVRFTSLIVLAALLTSGSDAATRLPAVAGAFYPADSAALAKMVSGHLQRVTESPEIDGQIMALIVPHAGLVYSGQIAAHAYKLLEGSGVNKVVLCGPSHRFGFDGISVYGPDVVWKTPLGSVPCNNDLCNQLLKHDGHIKVIPDAHQAEHCLEVQLPYLQEALGDFEIVPMLMGYPNHETIALLSGALTNIAPDEHTIMVASTDWQHYRPAPQGWALDSAGIDCIKRLDSDGLESYLNQKRTEACGGAAAAAIMRAAVARGADKVKILKYGDSGDVSGDKSSVVGYVAAVIYKSNASESSTAQGNSSKAEKTKSKPGKFVLTDDDRRQLLQIARSSIEAHLNHTQTPEFELSPILLEDGAAFVTLKKGGSLRGCIGYTQAIEPLARTVADCAIKAAVEDPRFPPVTASELPDLHIEISVLTPLQRVKSLTEIRVGRDGLMISMGRHRGLLLPQVATDYGWSETEFLEQTCRKAGLPHDAYKSSSAVIERFQAIIFEED